MVERIDIERALDDLISNEEGMRFQGLGVALAQRRWPELIACERHNDLGLDAYASATNSANGVGKGLACSITATFGKLSSDAKAAKEYYGPFSNLVFATAQKVTKKMEKEWADKIRADYGYELTVIPRADIIATLQIPENAWMCRTHLRIHVPFQFLPGEVLQQIRDAAYEEAALWAAHPRLAGKPLISLNAVKRDKGGNDTHDMVATGQLRSLLVQGGRLVLEAPAGRGKTTALIQMGQTAGEGIPILVDLPRWVRSGLDILDYIVRIPAFRARGIEPAALARSPNDEPYLFLLNGWNEISTLHSQEGAEMLRNLAQQFPAAGILIATRTHHIVPPLPSATRLHLLPLSPDQRFRYLVDSVGADRTTRVMAAISHDRTLEALTRTPFALSEVATIVRGGQDIPNTKLALLRAVISLMEQSEEHGSQLQGQPLWGRAEDYLRALAIQLATRSDVVLSETEARAICHAAAAELANTGQISTSPQPAEILSTLTSHHVLERLEYPSVSFRFDHQQFQEYYAALEVRGILYGTVKAAQGEKSDAFIRTYINLPSWEEPLRMIAEDLSESQIDVAAGKLLVQGALRVDPVLAGRLFHLSAPAIQSEVQPDLAERFRTLYASSNPEYRQLALAGMLASGSGSFRDSLIPLLTAEDQQRRLAVYRAGPEFQPSSLGDDWEDTVSRWNEQQRIEFVSELTMHQGMIEVGLAFVKTDPSRSVRLEALRALIWAGHRETAASILSSLADDDFAEALQKFYPEEIPSSLWDRALGGYRTLLETASDPKIRLHFTLALAELEDAEITERLKNELDALPSEVVKEVADYQLRRAVDILRKSDPQWLSDWVMRHVLKGVLWRDSWQSLILGVPADLQGELLRRVRTENLRLSSSQGVIAVLEAAATPNLAKEVFYAARDSHRELLAEPHNEERQAIDHQLRGLLRGMPPPIVIEGLSGILSQEPQYEDLQIIAGLFSRIGEPESETKAPLPEELRARVRAYFKSAVPGVLEQEDLDAEIKARLSLALAATGQFEDAEDLVALIRADIRRVREWHAARSRGDHSPRVQRNSTSWSPWHVQALINLMRERSEGILCDLLSEPEYEMDAACGLEVIASKSEPGPSAIMAARHGPATRDYRKVHGGVDEWQAAFHADLRERVAGVIRKRALALLEESQATDPKSSLYHFRLKELARVLAALDPHASADLVFEILELPLGFDGWRRVALLEALVFAGVALPAQRILTAFEPVIDDLRKSGVHNNNASLFGHVLCVLPFLDAPAQGIGRIRELLSEFKIGLYGQGELLMAIGQCSDEAGLSFLIDMVRNNVEVLQNFGREWLEAVAASPLPRARPVLLCFIDPEVDVSVGNTVLPNYAIDILVTRITGLARTDEALVTRILDLTAKPVTSDQQRVILAKVVSSLDRPEALMAGLNLIDDSAPQPLPYDVGRAIEDLFLEKRPHNTSSQAYTLVPRAAADIKERLFQILRTDPKRARTAGGLLAQIEEWRLEYGRPASEPRHPVFESGDVWPPS